jgi:hypothetical protein
MRNIPLLLGLGALACGPAAPPASPAPASLPPSSAAAVATGPAYDLSPVAEPAELLALIRWKNPGATISSLVGCAGLPPELAAQGERAIIAKLLRDALGGQLDAPRLAAAVALDAPMDLVVALDPKAKRGLPISALAVGLTSFEEAKRAAGSNAGSLEEIVPGMWRVGEKSRRNASCAIAVSTGSTRARLVCSRQKDDVTALAPYLTRTLPTAPPSTAHLHAELRYAPIDARYGEMLRGYAQGFPVLVQTQVSLGDSTFDRALSDATAAIADEATALMKDLDKLTLSVSAEPSACLTASAVLKLRDKSSWLAGAMLDRPERAGPPPAIFWRAPKDSASAFFGRSTDPARFSSIIKTLRTLLESGLAKLQIGSANDRKAFADLIAIPLGKDANTVQASGHSDAPPPKAGEKTPAIDQQTVRQKVDDFIGSLGWTVIGVDEDSDAIRKWLRDLVEVYGRKGLLDPLRKELGTDARFLPSMRMVPPPAALGKRALDVEIKFDVPPEKPVPLPASAGKKGAPSPAPAATKAERLTFSLHILLMLDGKNTWLAFGANKDELVKHLSMTKSTAPESDSLASRAGLEPLRTSKNMSGGFFMLSAFTKAVGFGFRGLEAAEDRNQLTSLLRRMPNKGETPIFITTTGSAASPPQGEVTLRVDKGSIEDLGALLMGVYTLANSDPRQMSPPPSKLP